MARAAVLGRLTWLVATVTGRRDETPRARLRTAAGHPSGSLPSGRAEPLGLDPARIMPGQARVYLSGPGMVARCPACGEIVIRLARGEDRAWLDLRGVSCLQLAVPPAAGPLPAP